MALVLLFDLNKVGLLRSSDEIETTILKAQASSFVKERISPNPSLPKHAF